MASRKICRNRKYSIKKKTEELSILCDVEAFAIITDHDGSDLMTWPENQSELKSVIAKCRSYNRTKKNHAEKVKKRKWVLSDWDDSWLDGLSGESLLDFVKGVRVKIEQAKIRAGDGEKGEINETNPNYWVGLLEDGGEANPISNYWDSLLENWEEANPRSNYCVGLLEDGGETNPSSSSGISRLGNGGETKPSSGVNLVEHGEGTTPDSWVSCEETNPSSNYWVSLIEDGGETNHNSYSWVNRLGNGGEINPSSWVNLVEHGGGTNPNSWVSCEKSRPNCGLSSL